MNFKKVNNITGWAVGLIACTTYLLTREASGSFWDCGEFVSSAFKLQNPHPPGAPLFTLLGRFFIVVFGDSPSTAAHAVNLMSALASGCTILFLFWTITHFARKTFVKAGEELTTQQLVTVMASGVVGALAYCFSDSFWFSAVEGEVYALSSFFTALVFWAILKWEHADELAGADVLARRRADRWIVFLFFMTGLSIGVHLLNLLTIPAVVMVYYYRRYTPTIKGGILAFIIGALITVIVQVVVIQWLIKIAGYFDILFVNNFGASFFSGFIFFFVLLAALIWLGIYLANKKSWSFLRLGLWSFTFILIGYSMYITSLIRSNANTAIDMNNVDNPMSLIYWLSREQYGTQPILYGPHFAAEPKVAEDQRHYEFKEGDMKYVKAKDAEGHDKYNEIGRDNEYVYENKDMQIFPRVWDRSNDQGHADFYIDWLNLNNYPPDTDPEKLVEFNGGTIRRPAFKDNVQWFFSYQMSLMYWRYFMWNFAGKQNDIQGLGNKRDGNWITGLSFLDNARLGNQDRLPDSIKHNKAHNQLYLLPFILGIIGCVFQFVKNKTDWIVTFLVFFITGIGIVLYLNQPGNQPRERDYAYVGSFYGYAIWIGLAVAGIVSLATGTLSAKAAAAKNKAASAKAGEPPVTAQSDFDSPTFVMVLGGGTILSFMIGIMSAQADFGGTIITGFIFAALFAGFTAAMVFLARAASSGGKNVKMANIITAAICIIVPIIMAQQEWDDHDRSKKVLARDIAKDYLESCAPNAVLFTFGDNDTYPLWYAQEVEGIRRDIRIINNSLLGIDWYINQLRYKINESDSLDVMFSPQQIEGHKREYLQFSPGNINQNTYYPLYDALKKFGGDEYQQTFPAKKFIMAVDTAAARKNGTVNADDTLLTELRIEIPQNKNNLARNDLITLSIIAANNFKRPIYFTSPYGELGFGQYLRKDGIAYRLVPAQVRSLQQNWIVYQTLRAGQIRDNNEGFMFKNLMEKFSSGNADKQGVYFDEENRRHLLTLRSAYGELAGNMADDGKKEDAKKVLSKFESMINLDNFPYAMVGRYNQHNQTTLLYLESAYKAGDAVLADKVDKAVRKDLEQQKKYYDYMKSNSEAMYNSVAYEDRVNTLLLQALDEIEKTYGKTASTEKKENGGSIINTLPGNKKDTGIKQDTTKH